MLKDALALRERLERRSGAAYAVRRSAGARSRLALLRYARPEAPAMSAPHDPERSSSKPWRLPAATSAPLRRLSRLRSRRPHVPRTLSFFEMRSGRIWLECFRCRDFGAILDALGLERRDLHAVRFGPTRSRRPWPDQRRYPTAYRILE